MCVYVCILYICMYIYIHTQQRRKHARDNVQHATQTRCNMQHATCNTDSMQHTHICAYSMQHATHARCNGNATCTTDCSDVKLATARMDLANQTACSSPHAAATSNRANRRQPCNMQARQHGTDGIATCSIATCCPNLQHAAVQRATMQRQRATRSTFGLDRTRWRLSRRRSCKSPALEPRSSMRLPRVPTLQETVSVASRLRTGNRQRRRISNAAGVG